MMLLQSLMKLVKDHPMGTGNALGATAITNSTASLSGLTNEKYQLLHLTLSGLVALAAIVSYIVGMVEKRKQTKLLKSRLDGAYEKSLEPPNDPS